MKIGVVYSYSNSWTTLYTDHPLHLKLYQKTGWLFYLVKDDTIENKRQKCSMKGLMIQYTVVCSEKSPSEFLPLQSASH